MKKWIKMLVVFCFLLLTLTISQNVSAETMYRNGQVVKSGTIILEGDDEVPVYNFNYDGYSVYLVYAEVYWDWTYYDEYVENPVRISACQVNDYDDSTEIKGISLDKNEYGYIWFGQDGYGINRQIVFKSSTAAYDYKIKYRIEKYNGFAQNINISTKLNMKIGKKKNVGLGNVTPYGSFPYVNWKVSNSKVATINEKGDVTAKGKGSCVITGILDNGKKISCTVTVSTPSARINKSKYTLYKGKKLRLKMQYTNKKVKWKTSNRRVATVTSKGIVKAVSNGSCTITAQIGKKKYTCKIKVIYREPNFAAALTDYNTRGNYFVVKFWNWGNKPLYINTSNLKAVDVDYKSYDRLLRLSGGRTIKINPKKKVTVKFYVNGRVTWYDYRDFTIYYKFTYDGKKYEGHTWDSDSVYKKGKKWYYTYWTSYEEKYEDWSWTD